MVKYISINPTYMLYSDILLQKLNGVPHIKPKGQTTARDTAYDMISTLQCQTASIFLQRERYNYFHNMLRW